MAKKLVKKRKLVDDFIDSGLVQDAFSALDKVAPESSILEDSALSIVNSFIDTGSYALNCIISGSPFKGIPSGRIIVLAGPSGCGKTVMCAKIVANAQKQGRIAVYFDSEIAFDKQTAINCGCDPTRIKHVPVETVEQVRNAMVTFLNKVIETPALKGKFVFVLDSLANCSTEKEIGDAAKDHNASDMGLRAKLIKSMLRAVTYRCAKADIPLVITNHIYDDPAAMFESIKKNQGGGKGPEYLASIIVQMAAKQDKSKEDAALAVAKEATGGSVVGLTLNCMTTKNRFLPPFLETELGINFVSGFKRYAGLVTLCKAMDVFVGANTYTTSAGEKLGYRKDFENNDEVWQRVLPLLDDALRAKFVFSCDAPLLETEEIDNDGDDA